jgi:hypothetical protein
MSLADGKSATPGRVDLFLKLSQHSVSIDIVVIPSSLIARAQAPLDELGIDVPALHASPNSGLHELGEGFALSQYRLYLCPEGRLNANGGEGGTLHKNNCIAIAMRVLRHLDQPPHIAPSKRSAF